MALAMTATALLACTDSAAASTPNLHDLLAPPPSSDWVEFAANQADVLVGAFTAQSYASFVQGAGGTPTTLVQQLGAYGFVDGYSREWQQSATQDVVLERVFEFKDGGGAGYWYTDLKTEAEGFAEYSGEIPGAAAIPGSFGAVLTLTGTTERQWRVDFARDNLVVVVHTGSLSADLSGLAVKQATAIYRAVSGTSPGLAARLKGGLAGRLLVPAAIGGGLLVLVLAAVTAVAVLTGRRPATQAIGVPGVQMSADRARWWDGTRWRESASDPPPSARRSPDGAYWWDGAFWREVRR